jgi:hypothetical protein
MPNRQEEQGANCDVPPRPLQTTNSDADPAHPGFFFSVCGGQKDGLVKFYLTLSIAAIE